MNIKERFAKVFPTANIYWNGKNNQLSLHFINQRVNVKEIETKAYKELAFCGLLSAVESIRILSY